MQCSKLFASAIIAGLLTLTSVTTVLADVKPGDPKPFHGTWTIAFPEGAGVIVNKPDTTCDAPAIITPGPNDMITIKTPKGGAGNWAVKSFGDKTPWWRDDDIQQTLVAKWINANAFLLAGKDASGIKTDWDGAKQWTRCQ